MMTVFAFISIRTDGRNVMVEEKNNRHGDHLTLVCLPRGETLKVRCSLQDAHFYFSESNVMCSQMKKKAIKICAKKY